MADTSKHLLEESTAEAQKAAIIIGGTFEQAVGFTPDITTDALEPTVTPVVTPSEPTVAPPVELVPSVTATPPTEDFTKTIKELETAVGGVSFADQETTGATRLATQTAVQQARIAEIDKQFSQLNVERTGALDVAEARNVLQPFAEGEAGRRQRLAITQQMNLNIEKAALQGEISLAKQIIDRKVDLEFSEQERELNAARANVVANFDAFSASEKKRAEALLLEIDGNLDALATQKAARKEIEIAVASAVRKGLSKDAQDRALASDNIFDVERIIGEELGFGVEGKPFTLGEGQIRFDSAGNVIAEGGEEQLSELDKLRIEKARLDIQKLEADLAKGGGIVAGISPITGKVFTTAQSQAGTFAVRIEQAEDFFSAENLKIFSPLVGDFMPERFKSDARKQFEQAEKNLITAILRRESGAAISSDEFKDARDVYVPQVSDPQDVLVEKAISRKSVFQGLVNESVGAFEQLKTSLQETGGDTFTSSSGNTYKLPN